MSVLVTGGSGCLGSHLLSILTKTKGKLVSFAIHDPLPYRKLRHVEYIRGDLLEYKAIQQVLSDFRPNEIYHCASQASVGLSQIKPYQTLQTNILGTHNLFEAIRHTVPKARVILLSSSEIYGSGMGIVDIIHRESDPPNPYSAYATSKASCELLATQYVKAYHLDVVVARLFHFTGPGQSLKYVLPSVASQIARIELYNGDTIIFTGNLDVSRDYLDVRDMARAVALLASRGNAGEVYNICSGKARTIRDLVDYIIGISGFPIDTRIDPALERANDIPLLVGSPEKMAALTGWKPIISIEDSLRDLYRDIKSRIINFRDRE